MPGWILAIDVGTTSTAAARRVGDRVELIQLQGGPRMPSLVFWREGTGASSTGRLVLGVEAEELSSRAPWCLERTPKSRLGEEFIQLGEKQLRPVEIIGAILREVHNEAMSLSGGEAPAEIRLTHPARWRKSRLDKLAQAAQIAGLSDPIFVPEPVAAAVHFASERLSEGEHVAVYDLGGGTLDTAVLKRGRTSFEVIGRTGGDEELGGEDFDDLLYRHLGDQLPGETWEKLRTADERQDRIWAQANRELLRHARRAKEGLSRNPQYEFYLPPPIDQELEANVADFERLIASTLRGTVAELERTILAAGLQPSDMAAVYLAGGSSRIPLVGRLIQERLGILSEHLDDPKAVIALGAARLDRAAAMDSSIATPPLPEADAPIPPLPGSRGAADPAATEPPQHLDPNATKLAGVGGSGGSDPNATELDRPIEPTDPPERRRAPSPPPDRPERAPTEPDQPDRRDGGNRGKIIAGVAAAVLVLGGIGAAVGLSGGDSDPPPPEPTPEEEDPPPPPTPDEKLKELIAAKYRDCTQEQERFREEGANAGLVCDAPPGFSVTIESYTSSSDLRAAFLEYARGRPTGICAEKWGVRGTWYFNRPKEIIGDVTCYQNDEGGESLYWTDDNRLAIAFLDSDGATSEDAILSAWGKLSQP